MMSSFWLLLTRLLRWLFHSFHMVAIAWETLVSLVSYVTRPWRNFFWLCLYLYIALCGQIVLLTTKLLGMPIWILTAVRRENLLEAQLHDMCMHHYQSEQRNRELESRLKLTCKECEQVKELLKEAESVQKVIIEKYQLLQFRVLELEEENDAFKKQGERISKTSQDNKRKFLEQKDLDQSHPLRFQASTSSVCSTKKETFGAEAVLHEGRGVALSSSMFSVVLSLLVGIITWHAQDPCIPLVLALFMVVCMSLTTVLQFFLSIDGRPSFDAVALLSFNWFMLGTLVYPTLPNIAQTVVPNAMKLEHWLYSFVGIHHVEDRLKSLFL